MTTSAAEVIANSDADQGTQIQALKLTIEVLAGMAHAQAAGAAGGDFIQILIALLNSELFKILFPLILELLKKKPA